MRDEGIKNHIFNDVRQAASLNLPLHVAYRRYLEARRVGGLMAAFHGSGQRSLVDPVIELHHVSKRKQFGSGGVVIQDYTTWSLLRREVLGERSALVRKKCFTSDATQEASPLRTPTDKDLFTDLNQISDNSPSQTPMIPEQIAPIAEEPDREGPALIAKQSDGSVRTVKIEDLTTSYSTHHCQAASLIQKAWRRQAARKASATTDSRDTSVLKAFYAAYRGSAFCRSVPRPYRHAMLGPLPHLGVVVDVMVRSIGAYKKYLKMRMGKAVRHDLEKVTQKLTKANTLWARVNDISKQISIDRIQNHAPELLSLRKTMAQLPHLYEDANSLVPRDQHLRDVDGHLVLGMQGLKKAAVIRPTEKKLNRPALNTREGANDDSYQSDVEEEDKKI